MSDEPETTEPEGPAPVFGLLAEYKTTADLIHASKKVRDAGFRDWDTYTPFPVHGIEKAMGIKMTVLPWIVFGAGITGFATAEHGQGAANLLASFIIIPIPITGCCVRPSPAAMISITSGSPARTVRMR